MIIDTKRVGAWLARAYWYAAVAVALFLAFEFVSGTAAYQQAEVEIGVYQAKALQAIAQELHGHST